MRKLIPISLLLLACAVPAWAKSRDEGGWRRTPDLNGTWYLNGDENSPCRITQRGPGNRALFINENGDRARGTVRGDRIWVPDWDNGRGGSGLAGRVRGNRIDWANGSTWTRGRRDNDFGRNRVPNLSGTWYLNGDGDSPCRIIQRRGSDRAQFINENGDRAGGTVRGDRVWIPDWDDGMGGNGLRGRVRGDRIVWPNGTYWSR
jgi:hypothetical protein